jgi:hypothetical protein
LPWGEFRIRTRAATVRLALTERTASTKRNENAIHGQFQPDSHRGHKLGVAVNRKQMRGKKITAFAQVTEMQPEHPSFLWAALP